MRFLTQRRNVGDRQRTFSSLRYAAWVVFAVGFLSGCTIADPEYCASNDDCERILGLTAGGPQFVCHPTRNYCIPWDPDKTCFKDEDCRDNVALPRCNLTENVCVPCVLGDSNDTSCSHFMHAQFCGSVPNSTGGTGTSCVACLKNLDCPETAPICDGEVCRKCQKHTDCEGDVICAGGSKCTDSMVCIGEGEFTPDIAGSCAQNGTSSNGQVVYVYSKAPPPGICDNTNTGLVITQPLCDLDSGYSVAQAQGRLYIRVLGGDYDPTANAISSGRYVFIGSPSPSRAVLSPAVVKSRQPTFAATDNGNVTVDEFDLRMTAPNNYIATCQGGLNGVPIYTLRNSIVRGGTAIGDTQTGTAGVLLQQCRAKVYGNIIGLTSMKDLPDMTNMSHQVGIQVTNNSSMRPTSFDIENNIIAGCWRGAFDASSANNTNVVFRFNTLVGNGRGTMPNTVAGGISCPSPFSGSTVTLGYSILSGNSTDASKSQFYQTAQCRFKQLVVGMTETATDPELIKLDAELDDSFVFIPQSQKNSDCCIDKVLPGTGETFPTIDIRGTARPQGPKWDIGAYELPSK